MSIKARRPVSIFHRSSAQGPQRDRHSLAVATEPKRHTPRQPPPGGYTVQTKFLLANLEGHRVGQTLDSLAPRHRNPNGLPQALLSTRPSMEFRGVGANDKHLGRAPAAVRPTENVLELAPITGGAPLNITVWQHEVRSIFAKNFPDPIDAPKGYYDNPASANLGPGQSSADELVEDDLENPSEALANRERAFLARDDFTADENRAEARMAEAAQAKGD